MKKLQITKTQKLITFVVAIVLILYGVFSFLVMPRLVAWVVDRIPGATAVQKTLETNYPQEQVSFSDQTIYSSNRQRILTVGLTGKKLLTLQQKVEAKAAICSALGQNTHQYTSINLRSSVKHQFLAFFYQESDTESFKCP